MPNWATSTLRCTPWILALAATASGHDFPYEPASGALGRAVPLQLEDIGVDLTVDGGAYQATMEVDFKNPSGQQVEGVMWLPVPKGAVERGLIIDNNGILMEGQVRSRDRAVRTYRTITRPRVRTGGKDPVLLERIDDAWLRATIFPVVAGADVKLTFSFVGTTETLGELDSIQLPLAQQLASTGQTIRTRVSGGIHGTTGDLFLHVADQQLKRLEENYTGHQWKASGQLPEDGQLTLFFQDELPTEPIRVSSFRPAAERGYFLLEVAADQFLDRPLAATRTIVLLDLPEGSSESATAAGTALYEHLIQRLSAGDRIEAFSPQAPAGEFGHLVPAAGDVRTKLRNLGRRAEASGPSLVDAVLDRVQGLISADASAPIRLCVLSSVGRDQWQESTLDRVRQLTSAMPADFAVFSAALGPDVHADAMAEIASAGFGRSLEVPSEEHAAYVADTFVNAVRHPVLRHPSIEIQGASEVCQDSRRSITFGDSLRIVGRYDVGGVTVGRVQAVRDGQALRRRFPLLLPEQDLRTPSVATLWAARRAEQLRSMTNEEDPTATFFLTRLNERYGLLGRETVLLALEPDMLARMPQLVGPGLAGSQLAVPTLNLAAATNRPARRPLTAAEIAQAAQRRDERNLLAIRRAAASVLNRGQASPNAASTQRAPNSRATAPRATAPRPTSRPAASHSHSSRPASRPSVPRGRVVGRR